MRVMAKERLSSDYALHLVEHGDHLQVEVSGGIDAQAVRIAYWREIVAEAKERGLRKLLVTDRRKGSQRARPSSRNWPWFSTRKVRTSIASP
jgi:hypothetical protein